MHNTGLVGVGYWGENYLRVLNEIPDSELQWVADLDDDRLASVNQKYPKLRCTNDYTDLRDDSELDAVVLATPPQTHYEIASEFLRAGIDVLVEKPLTTDPETANELAEIATETGQTLVVGHIFEYHPAVRRLKQSLTEDGFGDIYYLEALRTGLGPIRSDVSALWDLAVHDVSIFTYLIESDVRSVNCTGHSFLQDVNDTIFLSLEFEDGTVAHTHCSWLHPQKTRKVTVVGNDKMAVFNDTDSEHVLQIYDNAVDSSQPSDRDQFHFSVREGDVLSPKIEMREPLKIQTEHFLDCAENGARPLTGGREGARVVEILSAAERSLAASDSVKSV